MKKIILIFTLMLVVLVGCKKNNEFLDLFGKNWWGQATAEINGKQWSATGCNGFAKGDIISLGFSEVNKQQILNDFTILSLPLKLGKQFVPKKSISYDLRVDGDNDLLCAIYDNLHDADSLQNWVEITEYNPQTKEIKGKFSCNMLIDPKGGNAGVKCNPSDPDVLRIRNGVFHTKIVD